jgi:predicted component of type VI protein secretion system
MARKTVITKVLDVDAQDGIIEFPQNRTLYADQFTDEAPNSDEEREGFKPKNMKDVFEHFQPSKKGVALTTEEGGAAFEDFSFKSIKDFEDEQLIEQSELLSTEKGKIDALNSVISQLEKNKTLRNALKDEAARSNLANALKALLAEIEDAEK